jgi:cysteinyl-tRNA synthetase
VKYWLHTGVLQIGGVEMHKSLGNFITIREMLSKYDAEVLRLYYASTHYKKPIDFDEKEFEEPKHKLDYFYNTIRNIQHATSDEGKESADLRKALQETKKNFVDAMNNDFNTPLALTHLTSLARKANTLVSGQKITASLAEDTIKTIRELGSILGILEKSVPVEAELPEEVRKLISQREEARRRKDWKQSDTLREQIRKLGFIVEDTPEGPVCRKASR